MRTIRRCALSLCVLLGATTLYAQSGRVVLPRTQLRVEEIIRSVQEQTGYVFAFNRRMFDVSRSVRVESTETNVRDLLKSITYGTGHSWLLHDSYIVIHYDPSPKEPSTEPESAPEIDPRTNDIYALLDPDAAATFHSREPIRQRDTILQPTPPVPVRKATPQVNLPAPVSSWHDPDVYTPILGNLPRAAVKTNLLYSALTLTPNLGIEWGLNARSSIELTGSWNQINHEGLRNNNKKLNHGIARLEYRRWLCERYNGHFFGAHLFGMKYNVGGYDIPTLFERESRYEGSAFGVGVTYGYHLPLSRRWGLEFLAGVGMMRFEHTRFNCVRCGSRLDRPKGVWFGPTRADVTLVFML